MLSFLAEFTRSHDGAYTIIVMDEEGMEQPRQYQVMPRRVMLFVGSLALLLALLFAAVLAFTPLRELIPGYGSDDMRQNARLNTLRLAALQDSLQAQHDYMMQLRQLLVGDVDSALAPAPAGAPTRPARPADLEPELSPAAPPSDDWTDHQQPALPIASMPVESDTPFRIVSSGTRYLSSLQFPLLYPVEGFFTRGFDARTGHYAVDIAVAEGSMVRSIGDGYVIFADWTHEGGYAIAIQHADGYLSVYKHNQRLLKRVGDRVRARDVVATSGNSGEISTGPHLHFELWHDGLAQDPQYYFIGE